MTRFILNADEANMLLAMRAARWLCAQPSTRRDAILSYGEPPNEVVFFVRHNKKSIAAFQSRAPVSTEAG